jgi:hypothetical protein
MGYLDPGIFGMISQIGYVLLFALVSVFMFFFQPIKNAVSRVFKRQASETQLPETEELAGPSQPKR